MRSHKSSKRAALAWLAPILDIVFLCPPCSPWVHDVHMQGWEGVFHESAWLRTSYVLAAFPMCTRSHLISFLFLLWGSHTSAEDRLIWNQLLLPVTGTLQWHFSVGEPSETDLGDTIVQSPVNLQHTSPGAKHVRGAWKACSCGPSYIPSDLGEALPRSLRTQDILPFGHKLFLNLSFKKFLKVRRERRKRKKEMNIYCICYRSAWGNSLYK